MTRIFDRRELVLLCAAVLAAGALAMSTADPRLSALQFVPNADLLGAGSFLIDADVMWALDTFDISDPLFTPRVHAGLTDRVSVDIGCADGFAMGVKANAVKEVKGSAVPAVTLGMQNLFSGRAAYVFSGKGESLPQNEMYLVAAKSSEKIKLRVHAGVIGALSYNNRRDHANPFIGFEKYFGQRFYMTAEAQSYGGEALLSAFAAYRFLSGRAEFNLGVIDILGLSVDDPSEPRAARALVRAGFKVNVGRVNSGMDNSGYSYRDSIAALRERIDTLSSELRWAATRIQALSGYSEERAKEHARVVEELNTLRALYDQEPFDPELVRNALDKIGARKDDVLPHLRVIMADTQIPLRIRTIAVSLIGNMGDKASSEILISMLTRFEEPSLKTEIMIALGKIKETRAGPVLDALRSDPDPGVAFTAAEVYKSLFGDAAPTPAAADPTDNTVPERRINTR